MEYFEVELVSGFEAKTKYMVHIHNHIHNHIQGDEGGGY
jgi:hypothetical protein